MNTIKIILVDDHKMVREGIKTYLAEDELFEIVGEAENGQECLDQLEQVYADMVLTDLNMPVMDGLDLTKEIQKRYPGMKIIALTMMGESQHIKQMLAEGALGYLLKNCGSDELKMAIKSVMNGGTYYSPEVTKIIMNNIRRVKPKLDSKVAVEMPLTDREKQVLRLILKEYSNQEIAEELFISVRTVDAHKRNLLDKTGSKSVAGLVMYAVDRQLFEDI